MTQFLFMGRVIGTISQSYVGKDGNIFIVEYDPCGILDMPHMPSAYLDIQRGSLKDMSDDAEYDLHWIVSQLPRVVV